MMFCSLSQIIFSFIRDKDTDNKDFLFLHRSHCHKQVNIFWERKNKFCFKVLYVSGMNMIFFNNIYSWLNISAYLDSNLNTNAFIMWAPYNHKWVIISVLSFLS